jgi:hypothetical protein
MPNLINLPPFTEDGDVYVVVETPRGSRAKFDYNPKLKTFALSKSLLTGLTYPHDWGFVPSTKADDGDPIDIMVVHDAATFPGIVLTCRVIGILQIEQNSKGKTERNDRLFAVIAGLGPRRPENWGESLSTHAVHAGSSRYLLRPANWAKHSFGPWLTAAANRLHHNVLATALANKLARISWTVLVQARSYETRVN